MIPLFDEQGCAMGGTIPSSSSLAQAWTRKAPKAMRGRVTP